MQKRNMTIIYYIYIYNFAKYIILKIFNEFIFHFGDGGIIFVDSNMHNIEGENN